MRVSVLTFFLAASALSSAVNAAPPPDPVKVPTKLSAEWQAPTRALFKSAIEIPSVIGRTGANLKVVELFADTLRKAGFSASDIKVLQYEGLNGDKTAALVVRWRAAKPTARPMLIVGHTDVVEAKREDWKYDPFVLREENGYFFGRGTADMKNGLVGTTMALIKLRKEGFQPRRDIILFFNGDEETMQNGIRLGTDKWRALIDAEFALNADGGAGAYGPDFTPLNFSLNSAEKTYQTYFFTVRNRGGHSSRPRDDNAIYDLSEALLKLRRHRFEPTLNDTTRGFFAERQKHEKGPLGDAMRRWLANEKDGAAADIIESYEVESGRTRTRCVATMLDAGHADNALPQRARGVVNCRVMPGVEPATVQAELQTLVGPGVEVTPDPSFIGYATPVFPIREDVLKAFTRAVRTLHGPAMPIMPIMDTGTSDAAYLRVAGIPTFGADGNWYVIPDDERMHGLDERIPVRSLYDNVLHWEMMVRDLAG